MRAHRGPSPVLVRGVIALVAGAVVAVLLVPLIGVAAGLLSGWSVFCAVEVVWVLTRIWPLDAAQTRAHARREDPGRSAARAVALIGSLASLGGIVLVLLQSEEVPRGETVLLAGIAVAGAAASWAVIQVDFLLRLTAQYFSDPEGGIEFAGTSQPVYTDFAYAALTIGIAYSVSDTTITSPAVRRMVIGQALLTYLFGAVILATIISLVTGL